VRFTVDAFPNEFFKGNISEIRLNPQTVQNVVTYSVIISIRNPDLKLKPGMTANITITVDQRENVLKVPNAALRYTPSGMQREHVGLTPASWSSGSSAGDRVDSRRSTQIQTTAPSPSQLAPGQKWNPANKIKMVPPKRITERPGLVFVLSSEKKPEARRVVLGITDGSLTEMVSGDLAQGDQVIIGDSTQGGAAAPPAFAPFGGFGPKAGSAPADGRGR
jgi:HlyD family secretion protein